MSSPETDAPSGVDAGKTPGAGGPSREINITQNVAQASDAQVIGVKVGTLEGPLTVNETRVVEIAGVAIPLYLLIGLVVVTIFGALGAWLYFVPARMNAPFNVAVAQFGETDRGGAARPSEELQPYDRSTFQALRQELAGLPPQFNPLVWHSSLFPLETRAQIPVVDGTDDRQRAGNAARLANQIGADLLFYGTYDQAQSAFTLNFYISPRLKFATNEIIGADQLGAPIHVSTLTDPVSRTTLNRELTARTDIASRFTLGMMYVLAGYPDDALRVFEQVNLQSAAIGGGLQELVYFFIGEEALGKGRDADALAAFDKALTINPTYARAQLGVGGVYLLRADRLEPARRLAGPELDQAIAEFKKALALPPPPAGAPTDVIAHLGLGTAYRDKGEAYLFSGDYANANAAYDQAIAEIGPLIPVLLQEQQYRLLAQAYLGRAEADQQKAYIQMVQGNKQSSRALYQLAAGDYAECINQLDSSPADEFLKQEIDTKCKPYRQQAQDALASPALAQ